ncbi:branched-chain amino acid ABC transporter permease [Rhodopila sp.]|uniref:branched-chain amino acid ABC transporter permease n=1 Tax=Rhodopila sp. TaxID=2480087 RepID=UPI003D0BD6A2
MDQTILLALLQDGLTTGAIYVLLAVGLLIAFSVTRVIFIPQGDLMSFAALTLASLIGHRIPGTVWMLDALCAWALVLSLVRGHWQALLSYGLGPAVLTLGAWAAVRYGVPTPVSMLLSLCVVTALGPLLYRFAYEPLGEASMLPLLIVSMALHFVLIGIGLYCFGAEGVSTPALTDASFDAGPLQVSGQSLCVGLVCLVMVGALRWLSVSTLYGKALRAAASDRLGARLIGVDPALSGRAAFALASLTAAVSGLLIAPITPLAYDTGFEIGLKGFVAAVIGGLASYPLAAAGALVVGLLESFSGFWASQYRNIIVFALLIPVLIWLSLARGNAEDQA